MNEVVLDRLWSKVEFTTDCWNYLGGKGSGGYGRFWLNKKIVLPHRLAYEQYKGKIPEGLVIDHLCKNPSCVNPSHLEAVTQKENLIRSDNFIGRKMLQTHCIYGRHPLSGKNLYRRKNNMRSCRKCDVRRSREYQERRKLGR